MIVVHTDNVVGTDTFFSTGPDSLSTNIRYFQDSSRLVSPIN